MIEMAGLLSFININICEYSNKIPSFSFSPQDFTCKLPVWNFITKVKNQLNNIKGYSSSDLWVAFKFLNEKKKSEKHGGLSLKEAKLLK